MGQYGSTLYHYGIPGQKWGTRRWQNPDGTFNAAGKLRYFGTKVRDGVRGVGKKANGLLAKNPKVGNALKRAATGALGGAVGASIGLGASYALAKFAGTKAGQALIQDGSNLVKSFKNTNLAKAVGNYANKGKDAVAKLGRKGLLAGDNAKNFVGGKVKSGIETAGNALGRSLYNGKTQKLTGLGNAVVKVGRAGKMVKEGVGGAANFVKGKAGSAAGFVGGKVNKLGNNIKGKINNAKYLYEDDGDGNTSFRGLTRFGKVANAVGNARNSVGKGISGAAGKVNQKAITPALNSAKGFTKMTIDNMKGLSNSAKKSLGKQLALAKTEAQNNAILKKAREMEKWHQSKDYQNLSRMAARY